MDLCELRTGVVDPVARGEAYGRALAPHIRRATELYADFWHHHGLPRDLVVEVARGAADALRDWWPEAQGELEAVARGAEVDTDALLALNARTELMARTSAPDAGECSAVASVRPTGTVTGQTWDWHPSLAPVGVLLEQPSATGGVKTFTEPGMLAKIGVNAAGLGLHFNILHHRADGGSTHAVPVHLIARRLLHDVSTVDEAARLAASAPVAASTVLTVADHGSAACLELSPAGMRVVRPDDDGYLWHTNHFRHPDLQPDEATVSETTRPRGEHLDRQRSGVAAAHEAAHLPAAMCGTPADDAPINVRPLESDDAWTQTATLLTVALDLDGFQMHVSPGLPADFSDHVF